MVRILIADDHEIIREAFLTPRVSQSVLEGFLHRDEDSAETGGPLTGRELEVLKLVTQGRSSREEAEALGISVKTVDTHRANLMRKLDLHSVGELVRYAIRNRIIEP
ncbi:MAG: response regulator transcription factor [Candidatus Latescibacterota bacterium]|jgi:DNA-binding NarL/FixJ family response regulator